MIFCVSFVLMVIPLARVNSLWLLHSGKMTGYKVKIAIPDPCILEKGEVLANEGCRGNYIHG